MSVFTRSVEQIDLPAPSPGTQRFLQVIRYGQPGDRPKAYIQTGLHADENPGMLVLKYLDEFLKGADREGRMVGEIVLLPVANPIGLNQHVHGHLLGRYELDSGQNFNRHYPDLIEAVADVVAGQLSDDPRHNVSCIRGAIKTAAKQLPAIGALDTLRKVLMGLASDADICLDLHCDTDAVLYMFAARSVWPDAMDLAAQIGSQATLLADLSGGNPFDETIGSLWLELAGRFPGHPIPAACLAATIELRGQADVSSELAALDAENLFKFLLRRGLVDGDPGPLPELLSPATPFEGVDEIRSPCAGIVVYKKAPGDFVAKGEVVARIVDPLAAPAIDADTPIVSRVAGMLYSRRSDRFTLPGQPLCHVAGDTPLPDRVPGKLMSD